MSNSSRYYLEKLAKKKFHEYPSATIAYYGPTADFASKVVVGIFLGQHEEPDVLERFFSQGRDVRFDDDIGDKVLALIRWHGVTSVGMVDRIIGCPHEEGSDYPDGESCPQCPFWAGRDRFTHERIQ